MTSLEPLGWHDDLASSFAPHARKGHVPARVIGERKGFYLLASTLGEVRAGLAGRLRHAADSRADLPAVGDWVALRPTAPGEGFVQAILPRRNVFSRKVVVSGGRRVAQSEGTELVVGGVTEEQVIASNLDTLFVVTAPDEDFSPRRIERYLTAARRGDVEPVVVLNKCDLIEPSPDGAPDPLEALRAVAADVAVHPVSALEERGLDSLAPYLEPGRTIALIGSSGVGKSTLINRLLGEDRLATAGTREGDGKGRHTTTWRELVVLPSGALLIDNPGIRELQVWADEAEVNATFADIERLQRECLYSDCQHQSEPGCAIKQAIAAGDLDPERYRSYLDLKTELAYLDDRKTGRQRLGEQKEKVKEKSKREGGRTSKRTKRKRR